MHKQTKTEQATDETTGNNKNSQQVKQTPKTKTVSRLNNNNKIKWQ